MLSLKTNLLALTMRGASAKNMSELEKSIRSLSSGMRINSAKDNAANQAVANRLTSQQNALQQAQRNAGDGLSLVKTAEGAMDEINNRLQRIRELAVKGLSETNTLQDADVIQAEINLNLKEIDRMNGVVNFNGINLLNGSAGALGFQVGTRDNEKISLDLSSNINVENMGLKDLVLRGISGSVTNINTINGSARDMEFSNSNVSVNYSASVTLNAPQLVHSNIDNRYYIQDTGGDGKAIYYPANYSASWTTASGTGTVNISATSSAPLYNTVSQIDNRSILPVSFLDTSGSALSTSPVPTLTESNGQYYIEQDDYYYPASLIYGSTGAVTAQMTSATGLLETTFTVIPAAVTSTPDIDVATAAVTFRDASNNPLSASTSRLIKSGSQFMMEVDDGSGNLNYYNASVSMVTDGTTHSVVVTADNATSLNSFTPVTRVNGSSQVTLDPNKVNVRYTDTEGNTFSDVLRQDADGNYFMNLTGSQGAKKVTLVSQNNVPGSILLKTVNGLGETQLYYQSSITSSTDAVTNYTSVNILEIGDEIRLKTPDNPLAAIDNAIKQVDARRSTLGAVANRLESAQSQQQNMSAAVSASRSRIEDADYAIEVSNMARAQILQQSFASLMSKANQVPEVVLSLLNDSIK